MFHIGGEQELIKNPYYRDITNSGRSSLRLITQTANLQGKRLLLPNFLCEVIIDVLLEYDVKIDFYDVNLDFEFTLPENLNKYDALYLIKYFGTANKSFISASSQFPKCIIIDDVFSPYPQLLDREACWFSYNSLRKISPVADFSLIYSNFPLSKVDKLILPSFSSLKYEAKKLKLLFLSGRIEDESKYLSLFLNAEKLLDESHGIYSASTESVYEAIEFYASLDTETRTREKNYHIVKEMLGNIAVDIDAPFHSFLPVLLTNRNDVRRKLMADNIFLAVHWPECKLVSNQLSGCILSIPLDCRYDKSELSRLCDAILLESDC